MMMRWMECHPSVTAFAATILGLFVAAGVPLWLWRNDLRQKAKEKHEASGAFAAGLLVMFTGLKWDVPRARHMLKALRDTPLGNPAIPDRLRDCRLLIPTEVSAAMSELHHFDNTVVAPIRTGVLGVQSYNAFLTHLGSAAANDVKRFDAVRDNALPKLEQMLAVAEEGLDRLLGPTAKS